MEKRNDLAKRQEETRQYITLGIEKTFPALFFHFIGRVIARIFRLKKEPHWSVNAVILGILIFLPGILVSIATGEVFGWKDVHVFYLGLEVFAYLSSIVCHVNVTRNFLPGIRDGMVDFIQTEEDLGKLKIWLNRFWSTGKWLAFMLVGGLVVGLALTFGLSHSIGSFIGASLTIVTFAVSPFFVLATYVVFRVIEFPSELTRYQLELYESDPIRSEVIQRMIQVLNVYLYLVAGYVAVGTALVSLNPATRWWIYYCIGLGWIPTIAQFAASQSAIRKIVANTRWKRLRNLQGQIRELQERDLRQASEAEIMQIHRLMDLHDRISGKHSSTLNLETGLTLFNQLMIPVVGLLLGNLDTFIKMLFK